MFKTEPDWTYSFQDRFTDTLDYVFYSPQVLDLVKVEKIDNANKSKYIPNEDNPSDHLPMVVEFMIRVSPIRRLNSSN
jgi:mRNA deadenylase 3'-5' endonuclease subunit Ccr4